MHEGCELGRVDFPRQPGRHEESECGFEGEGFAEQEERAASMRDVCMLFPATVVLGAAGHLHALRVLCVGDITVLAAPFYFPPHLS